MNALLDELHAVVIEANKRGLPIAVIGAFALRTYLPRPDLRTSVDADLLTTSGGIADLESILTARGYRTFALGSWRRAERSGPERIVIDIAIDAIVDVRSFQKYVIDWKTVVHRAERGGVPLPVPRVEDLIAQKLVAAREKDLLDVVLVAADPSITVRGEILSAAVEAQDLEIDVMRGCLEAEAAIASGRMAQMWRERYDEDVDPGRLETAAKQVRKWVENGK